MNGRAHCPFRSQGIGGVHSYILRTRGPSNACLVAALNERRFGREHACASAVVRWGSFAEQPNRYIAENPISAEETRSMHSRSDFRRDKILVGGSGRWQRVAA